MAELPLDHRAVRRFNLSVPLADESVIEWLNVQENKSISVRTIIREYIEKDGYTDPMCRTVVQGPRRGRPPVVNTDESMHARSEPVVTPERVEPFEVDEPQDASEPEPTSDSEFVSDRGENDEIQLDENGMPILDY